MSVKHKHLGLALVLALFGASFVVATPPASSSDASLTGRVFAADGLTPRAGIVVALVDPQSRAAFESTPTDGAGAFTVSTGAAGTYTLVARSDEGAYLASEQVALQPGGNRPLALTLRSGGPNYQTTPNVQGAGGLPAWAKWVIAGGIGVAALLVIDDVTEDDEEDASPF